MVDLFLEAPPGDLPGLRQYRRPAARQPGGAFLPRVLRPLLAAVRRLRQPCAVLAVAATSTVRRGRNWRASSNARRWPKTRVRGDGGPRRDVVRRQRRRLPVRPVPQRPPDGARRQAVAQVAQPLRFDRRGAVLRLPDPGVLEPHAAGGRESGVALLRRPLRRDLPEPQAGGRADPLRETLLRAWGERNQGATTCSPTGRRPRPCSPAPLLCDFRQQRRRFGDSASPAPGTTGPRSGEVPQGRRLRAQGSALVFFDLRRNRSPGSWRTCGRLRRRRRSAVRGSGSPPESRGHGIGMFALAAARRRSCPQPRMFVFRSGKGA